MAKQKESEIASPLSAINPELGALHSHILSGSESLKRREDEPYQAYIARVGRTNDVPRLALADWLEEHPGKDDARAELIRNQFEQRGLWEKNHWEDTDRANYQKLKRREKEILAEHGERFAAEDLGAVITQYNLNPKWITFSSGFADLIGAIPETLQALQETHQGLRQYSSPVGYANFLFSNV